MAAEERAYFVLLSPSDVRFKTLPASDVLSWFQAHWGQPPETSGVTEELGGTVYGFDNLFYDVRTEAVPCPKDPAALTPLLERYIYFEGDFSAEPHFVHVRTDDDEEDIEYFFFDDAFLDRPEALDALPRLPDHAPEDDAEAYEALLRRVRAH